MSRITPRFVHADMGRISVSCSVAGTTLVVETECGDGTYRKQVLRSWSIDAFQSMVNEACARVNRDDKPEQPALVVAPCGHTAADHCNCNIPDGEP